MDLTVPLMDPEMFVLAWSVRTLNTGSLQILGWLLTSDFWHLPTGRFGRPEDLCMYLHSAFPPPASSHLSLNFQQFQQDPFCQQLLQWLQAVLDCMLCFLLFQPFGSLFLISLSLWLLR